jgi:hypothetical protein
MSNRKTESLVEEALLQMKSIEEAISENAKGILASTMKEEIGELVRESILGSKRSLREQAQGGEEPQEPEQEGEEEVSAEEEVVTQQPEVGADNGEGAMPPSGEELPPLDMSNASMPELMKVFKAMGDEDGFIIKKDGDYVHLKDGKANTEYLISLAAEEPEQPMEQPIEQMAENTTYELVFEDDSMMGGMSELDYSEGMGHMDEMYEDMDEMDYNEGMGHMDEDMYEGMGHMDEMYEDMDEMDYNEGMGHMDEMYEDMDEGMGHMDEDMYEMDDQVYEIDQESLENVVEAFKAKGKIGKLKTKIYPSKLKHGVTETGEDEISDGWMEEEEDDDVETAEAARTYGNGSKKGRGLRKAITPNRNLTYESHEFETLKEKNEEYRKALDFFRNKLNEVAIFNSNLAYATRLFTEHSTTKQEKINILRRFDNVDSLKESKTLYKSIKEELGDTPNSVVTESITQKVIKTPSNGSSSNLIESKAYENPQFMRMKDLMSKIK